MLDAVGDVCRNTHLCGHGYVRCAGQMPEMVQQLLSLSLVVPHIHIIIHHIQCHQIPLGAGIAHHRRHRDKVVGILRVFHRDEYLLIVNVLLQLRFLFLLQAETLRRALGNDGRDDAGEENHDDDAIQHLVTEQIPARCRLQLPSHHYHGDGTGSMGTGKTEHHVPRQPRHTEEPCCQVSRHGFPQCAEEDQTEYHPEDSAPGKEQPYIDQHTYTDQEVRNEQCVARELDAVHQR